MLTRRHPAGNAPPDGAARREGVRFHDGAPFTDEDVVSRSSAPATLRTARRRNKGAIGDIAAMTVVGRTRNPEFSEQIGRVYIMSGKAVQGRPPEDSTAAGRRSATDPTSSSS